MANQPETSARPERVPLREVLIYSLGVIGGAWAWAVNALTNPIFNIELGVNTPG